MIEVEIRGVLTKETFEELKDFLTTNGEHRESHDREMLLLTEYPGYSHDPTARSVDIRLRNTSGACEIMMKRNLSEDNMARKEVVLKLQDSTLATAIEIVKGFGCTKALRMHRAKDIYTYHDIEWSLVRAPKGIYYFEAEQEASGNEDIEKLFSNLMSEARALHLTVLDREQTKEFIAFLDKEVNEWIVL